MNAENLRQTVVVQLGSPSADATIAALYANCDLVVKKLTVINGATIAASNTDFVVINLKYGSTVVATLDTRAAAENGLTSLTGKAGRVLSAPVPAGSTLVVQYDETDAGTNVALTNCAVQIEYVRAQNK